MCYPVCSGKDKSLQLPSATWATVWLYCIVWILRVPILCGGSLQCKIMWLWESISQHSCLLSVAFCSNLLTYLLPFVCPHMWLLFFFFSLYTMSSASFECVAFLYNFLHEWCMSCSLFIFFWLFNFAVNNTFKFLYFTAPTCVSFQSNCSHYISCARKVRDPGMILLCTAKLALWFSFSLNCAGSQI